jgi:hypothetical protein
MSVSYMKGLGESLKCIHIKRFVIVCHIIVQCLFVSQLKIAFNFVIYLGAINRLLDCGAI